MANINYRTIASRLLANNAKKIAEMNKTIRKVADRKATLAEIIQSQPENYKPVRAILQANIRRLSEEYFDNGFVGKQQIHLLTWAIINEVQQPTDELEGVI